MIQNQIVECVSSKMKFNIIVITTCLFIYNFYINAMIQNRIVNGREATIGQFPYQLSLRRNTAHICGASVLDNSWVITAAHCIDGFEKTPKIFTLRMGSISRTTGGRIMGIIAIYKHPAYNLETMNYDVALLRVHGNGLRLNNVAPIKLTAQNVVIPANLPATVSGWGHMSSSVHVLSSVLRYTIVYTFNQRECVQNLKLQGDVTEAMFCAAAKSTDACQGDSGGPIVYNDTLIGIVSWGVGCADSHYPGVYARLAHSTIRLWIRLLTKL